MFGNTKGWGISALILVVVGLLIYFMGQPPQISPPTGTLPLALVSASLKIDPASLEIKPDGTDADSHDLYVQVIDDYKVNQFRYEKYNDVLTLEKANDKPPFLDWIVKAADSKKGTIFGSKPDLVINFENRQDAIDALKATGTWTSTLGLLLVRYKRYDEADPYLKGAFILGQRLYDERLRWDEYTAGTFLMANAAHGLAAEAGDKNKDGRVTQLDAFQSGIDSYQSTIVPVWSAISGIGTEGQPLNNAGDMFDIARNSKETMWKVEATLKLGRMRFMNNVTSGDQRGAVRVLKEMADNADLLPVRTAAAKGRDLTREDFRKIGGGS